MENVDLSGQKEYINMVYGHDEPGLITPPPSTASTTSTAKKLEHPKKEVRERKKKPKSACACSLGTFTALLILALLGLLLSAIVAHVLTKKANEKYVPKPQGQALIAVKYNMTHAEEEENEDDIQFASTVSRVIRDVDRHLNPNLEPISYNLSVRCFLPGFISLPKGKENMFEGEMFIKLRVLTDTNVIEMHSSGLSYPRHAMEYELYEQDEQDTQQRFARSHSDDEPEQQSDNSSDGESGHHSHDHHTIPIVEEYVHGANSTAEITTTNTSHPHHKHRHHHHTHEESETTDTPNTTTTSSESTNEDETTDEPEQTNLSAKLSDVKVTLVTIDDNLEKITFELSKPLLAGSAVILRLWFEGVLNNGSSGFFRSHYTDANGNRRFLAATDMEPQAARMLAPCFDEPKYKAVWNIDVTHPVGTNALSNADVLDKVVVDENWIKTKFAETLPMSSYLVALSVSDFVSNTGVSDKGIKVNVWSRPEAKDDTSFALDVAIRSLQYFEKYYMKPYPLQKIDLLALPNFESLAMENWGLLMYREDKITYNPKVTDANAKMHIVRTIVHEMCHQWFGDLVTMSWWNDLWLNEGFARFFEFTATDILTNEDYRMKEYFNIESLPRSMAIDSKSSSHPISYNVEKPSDIAALFDAITYDKGAAILRMLHMILGEEVFQNGVNKYIDQHHYKAATAHDLFRSFDEIVPKEVRSWKDEKFSVEEFVQNWISQMGYPVVSVTRVSETEVDLSQTRFKYDNLTEEKAKFRDAAFWYKWDIPLWYTIDGQKHVMEWLHHAHRIPVNASQLFVLNPDGIGYYRVNYGDEGWKKITEQLMKDHTLISPAGRARLISDAFALAENGQLEYTRAFKLIEYLDKETELLPWSAAINNFKRILNMYRDRADGRFAREYFTARVKPLYEKLEWEHIDAEDSSDFFKSELKTKVVEFYCQLHAADCTKQLYNLFKKGFLEKCPQTGKTSNCSTVPLPIRSLVYCEGVARSNDAVALRMLDHYHQESYTIERRRLLGSLSCSRDPTRIQSILTSVLMNTTAIPSGEATYFLEHLDKNSIVDYILLDYVTDNWKQIYKSSVNDVDLPHTIRRLPIYNKRNLEKLQVFLTKYASSTSKYSAFDGKLEDGRTRVHWLATHKDELNQLLKRRVENKDEPVVSSTTTASVADEEA